MSGFANVPVRSPRVVGGRCDSLRGLTVGGCCLAALLAGCSAGGGGVAPRPASLSATAERSAGQAARRQPYQRLVPMVIRSPRPFRTAALAAAPDRLGSPADARPLERAMAGEAAIRLTSGGPPAELRPLPVAATAPTIAAIGTMLSDYRQAFNEHDAAGAAAHWTAGCENVDLDSGQRTTGREAVRRIFAALFEIDPRARMEIDVDSIRPLRDDVAVVDGISRVAYEDGSVAGSRFSAVVVRDLDRWQLATVREAATAAESSPAGPLEELAWLVGCWENTEPGLTASSDCAWAPGRRFLVRNHVVLPAAGGAAAPPAGDGAIPGLLPPPVTERLELTEVIGWDPERQTIRSWIFSSEGRFAEATWSRGPAGWEVCLAGQGTDTGRSMILAVEPDGPDRLLVRTEGKGLEGLCPPTASFSRTAR